MPGVVANLRFFFWGRVPSSRPLGVLRPLLSKAMRRAKARGVSSVASRSRLRLEVGFLERGTLDLGLVVLGLEGLATGRGFAKVVGGRSEVDLLRDLSRLCL